MAEEALYRALQNVQSPNPSVQKPAESALETMSDQPGYCAALTTILSTPGVDKGCRLMAVICLKNTVNKKWVTRRRAAYTVPAPEKAALKTFLLQHFDEQEWLVAVQLAVLVAKVARHDWPPWPELFPAILQVVPLYQFYLIPKPFQYCYLHKYLDGTSR